MCRYRGMAWQVHYQSDRRKFHATDLAISPRTVEIHRARVMEKMGAGSVAVSSAAQAGTSTGASSSISLHPPPGRLGLLGMRERVALVGGTLEVESTPGAGTTVFARIPLSKDEG